MILGLDVTASVCSEFSRKPFAAGLVTVMAFVNPTVISDARIWAISCVSVQKVVTRF